MNEVIQKYRNIGFTLLAISIVPLMAHAGDGQAVMVVQDAADIGAENRANILNVTPSSYEVFIDDSSGFAFIKTPSGWKYVRQLDRSQLNIARAMMRTIQSGQPSLRSN